MAAEVGDIYQVAAVGRAFGQRILLTHHYRLTAINPAVSESDARDSLAIGVWNGVGGGDVLETTYLACLPPEYTLDYWRVQMVGPVRRAYVNFDRSTPGTHLASARTVNLGAALTLRSDGAGRHEHGTKHIGPIPEGNTVMTDGLLTPAYKAIVNTFGLSLLSHVIDAAIGADWTPIIYNKGAVPGFEIPINNTVGDTVRVQRRRTVGLGE